MINTSLAFVLARIAIATSLFGHGLVRLPKLSGFSHWMVGQFQKSMLPEALVLPFSYALPIAEFLTGLLLLVGLFTKQALVGGVVIMILLLFGTAMIENWDAIPSQLIHVAFLTVLLSNLSLNAWAVDKLVRK